METLVSIVFANWNGGEKTRRCLDSIKKQTYKNYEVIIVDNGSTDGSKEYVKKFSKNFRKFKLIENKENLGCVKALNQGFKKATGEFVLRIDNDIVLDKNLLKVLVKKILSNDKIGIVIPKVYYFSNPKVIDNIGFSLNLITSQTSSDRIDKEDKGQFEEEKEIDFVPGAVLLTRKKLLEQVNYLNPAYFVYYEDLDFSFKVRRLSYKIVYTPKTKAYHDCNKTDFTEFKIYHYIRSKLIFMKNNAGINNIFFFPFFFLIYSPSKLVSFIAKRKFFLIFPYIKGVFSGLFS